MRQINKPLPPFFLICLIHQGTRYHLFVKVYLSLLQTLTQFQIIVKPNPRNSHNSLKNTICLFLPRIRNSSTKNKERAVHLALFNRSYLFNPLSENAILARSIYLSYFSGFSFMFSKRRESINTYNRNRQINVSREEPPAIIKLSAPTACQITDKLHF